MIMTDEIIVITGEDRIRELAYIARIHYWRSVAKGAELGMRPPKGYSIKAFNAEYRPNGDPSNPRTWNEVYALCDAVIISEREDRERGL